MTLMTQPASKGRGRAGGCGCGGGGGSGGGCGGGCGGCGGSTMTASAAGSAFVRPRFFGGMLLTEDDLQAATDYVVGKRRLTNRYVLGAGVICGLDVSCDPCERGSVVVGPGYGIDCCGNDIVVECPTQVDVVALVRELRQRSGVDCGEPCDDRPCHDYTLNIVYTETSTEPVAPYADDTCAVGDCEFSRVQEGYRFELSCDTAPDEPTLIDILRECVDIEDEQVKEDAEAMARVVRLGLSQESEQKGDTVGAAEPTLLFGPVAPPTKAELDKIDLDRVASDGAVFEAALEVVRRSTAALAHDAANREGLAGFRRLPVPRRDLLSARTSEMAKRMRSSAVLVALPADEKRSAERLLEVAESQTGLAELSALAPPPPAAPAAPGEAVPAAEVTPDEVYVRDATRMKMRVLRGLEESGRSGCREYREISALKFQTLDQRSPYEVRVLGRTFLSVLVNCVCGAANPRCPTCTDARVPLARVRVEGCDVVSICDLERRWVHSPRALGYWFPIVEALRQLLEGRCCPDDCEGRHVDRLGEAKAAQVRVREADLLKGQAFSALRMVQPPEDVPVLRQVFEALGDQFIDVRQSAAAATAVRATGTAGDAAGVVELEKKLAELTKKVQDLEARLP